METVGTILAILIGSAGLTGLFSGAAALSKTARLRRRIEQSLELAQLLPLHDAVRVAMEHSARADIAELAVRQLVVPSVRQKLRLTLVLQYGSIAAFLSIWVRRDEIDAPTWLSVLLAVVGAAILAAYPLAMDAMWVKRFEVKSSLVSGLPGQEIINFRLWPTGVVIGDPKSEQRRRVRYQSVPADEDPAAE